MKTHVAGVITALVITLYYLPTAHALLVDNGIHTTDNNTGLVWLDLSETFLDSYLDTYNSTQAGAAYKHYRVATRNELETKLSLQTVQR